MTWVPLQTHILAACRVEEFFPHRGLTEGVVMHHRQVVSPLWTMFEGDAHATFPREVRDGLPKSEQLREMFFVRVINRIAAAFVDARLDHRAGKSTDRPNPNVRGNFDRAMENAARKLCLFWIERIAVIRADGRDANAKRLRLRRELR